MSEHSGGHGETLRLLASVYDDDGRGRPEVEAHLRAHGWEYVGDHWMGPEEIARVTKICKHCGERFEPFDPWTTGRSSVVNDCFGRDSEGLSGPQPKHEAVDLAVESLSARRAQRKAAKAARKRNA